MKIKRVTSLKLDDLTRGVLNHNFQYLSSSSGAGSVSDAIYVGNDGDDTSGDGSPSAPFATLQKAIDSATAGTTVVVRGADVFDEDVTGKIGVDVYAPGATLELNNGNQLTITSGRYTFRRLQRTSGSGAMVTDTTASSYAILVVDEFRDEGSGDGIVNASSSPLAVDVGQVFVGSGGTFLIDSATGFHVHLTCEDIYLSSAGATAIKLENGGTILATVHHIKETGAGVGFCTAFDIVDGDINISVADVGATTLANIETDGDLNIVAQQASGTVNNNGGVYTYLYNQYAGNTNIGTNLALKLDATAYKLSAFSGQEGSFLALGSDGTIVPTSLNIGAEEWSDDTEAVTELAVTTEVTVYELTVDQDFTAGSILYSVGVNHPYWRTTTVRLYQNAVLLDTNSYTGGASPDLEGTLAILAPVTDGDTFSITIQTSVTDAWVPNRTTIRDGGSLIVRKSGNEAEAFYPITHVPMVPAAGEFIGNLLTGTLTTLASAANRMDIAPFTVSYPTTIDQIGMSISTASAGSACGVIYASDANGRPTTLLAQGANVDTGSTGTKLGAVSFTFQPGVLYYVGVWTSAACTLRCGQTYTSTPMTWTNAATPARESVLRRTLAYGTADNWTYAAANHAGASSPFVLMRVA